MERKCRVYESGVRGWKSEGWRVVRKPGEMAYAVENIVSSRSVSENCGTDLSLNDCRSNSSFFAPICSVLVSSSTTAPASAGNK